MQGRNACLSTLIFISVSWAQFHYKTSWIAVVVHSISPPVFSISHPSPSVSPDSGYKHDYRGRASRHGCDSIYVVVSSDFSMLFESIFCPKNSKSLGENDFFSNTARFLSWTWSHSKKLNFVTRYSLLVPSKTNIGQTQIEDIALYCIHVSKSLAIFACSKLWLKH